MKNKCCICQDRGAAKLYKKINDHILLQCPKCQLVYLDEALITGGDFIETAKQEFDKKEDRERVEYWSFPHLYEKHKKIFHQYFQERLRRMMQFKPKISSVFDAGCGYGFWLKFCKDQGIEVKGIDISDEAVSYARRVLGVEAERTSLEDYVFEKKYDAVVVCDLLEHLCEPNSQLKKIYHGLSDDGILFVQVPNILGFKLPISHGFGLPYHLWQFNTSTLSKLLKKNGFKVLEFWTGVMGVVGVYESGGPRIWESIGWALAKSLKIGNRLMVAAKKI